MARKILEIIPKNLYLHLSYMYILKRPSNSVKNIFKEKSLDIIEWNNIKGIWETRANKNNLKNYFLRFFVWLYPSEIWNANIGKANLPI